MVELLRYVYDLPYDVTFDDQDTQLKPLTMVYVVADKYQVDGLKREVSKRMKSIIESHLDVRDFVNALRTIATGTTPYDTCARKMMVDVCITNLHHLHRKTEFISRLREHADLGADMIEHQNLPQAFPENWVCNGTCNGSSVPRCSYCLKPFDEEFALKNRYRETWYCEECGNNFEPICDKCEEIVVWQRRGLSCAEVAQSMPITIQ
jgi:hypothetical protein